MPGEGGAAPSQARSPVRPNLAAAREEFAVRVEPLLEEEPPTIVTKTILPPSGDPHDYLSFAPCYWPNPESPDGKPWVEREEFNLEALESVPDKPALHGLIEMVWLLGHAYRLLKRVEFAEKAAACLRAWFLVRETRMNPHLDFARAIPGICDGSSEGVLETRELGKLLAGTLLIEGSGAWSEADSEALKVWMREFVRWLRTSPLAREAAVAPTNHSTWYVAQSAAILAFCGDDLEAVAEVERGKDLITAQIDGNGGQPWEMKRDDSRHHCLFNALAFCRLARVGDRVGVDLWNHATPEGGSLRAAVRFLLQHWNDWPVAAPPPRPQDKANLLEVMYHAGYQYGSHYEEAWRQAAEPGDLNPLLWDDPGPARRAAPSRSGSR